MLRKGPTEQPEREDKGIPRDHISLEALHRSRMVQMVQQGRMRIEEPPGSLWPCPCPFPCGLQVTGVQIDPENTCTCIVGAKGCDPYHTCVVMNTLSSAPPALPGGWWPLSDHLTPTPASRPPSPAGPEPLPVRLEAEGRESCHGNVRRVKSTQHKNFLKKYSLLNETLLYTWYLHEIFYRKEDWEKKLSVAVAETNKTSFVFA